MKKLEDLIQDEFTYFGNPKLVEEFGLNQIKPERVIFSWQYSDEKHECFVIAINNDAELIYCKTGFGPSFPWGSVRIGERDLGIDSLWNAYLFEAFITSGLYSGTEPKGFELMGPGERDAT